MNTIGTFLRSARAEKKVSFEKLESDTKIKKTFLKAIEDEAWEKLPEYPVTLGFVRNIANSLGVSSSTALALLRRDYPPKDLRISPNPDVEKKFIWSPKFSFFIGVGVFVLLLVSYLFFQYRSFSSGPKLIINKPKEGEVLISTTVQVSGITDSDSKLEVNNQPVLVDENGNFEGKVEIKKDVFELEFKAVSRSGKETISVRKIQLDL